MRISTKAEQLMQERFGYDSLIALATCERNIPTVRTVDAYYDRNAFYVLTHALSTKMRQIEQNPQIAISGDWFTARGIGESLGFFGSDENREIAEKMREVFASWIDNGHSDLKDENTIILKIKLTSGTLISEGVRYDIDFGGF